MNTDTREAELARLISEQEKDDQWGHRVNGRGPSLDFTFEGGGTFADLVGYNPTTGEGGIRKIPRPQKWTRRAIIKHIRAWVKEYGRPPKCNEWNAPRGRGFPAAAAVIRHFGSWDDAIRAAGFEGRGRGGCDRQAKRTPSGSPSKYEPRVRKLKDSARFSSDDLAAAYVLYSRKGMSVPEIAALLWEKHGYPSARCCAQALRAGFIREGLPLRTKSEARMRLTDEHRKWIADRMRAGRAARGQRYLSEDERRAIAARTEPQKVIAAEFGVSQSTISRIRREANAEGRQ